MADFPKRGGGGGDPRSAKTLLSGGKVARQTVYETLEVSKGETLFGISSIYPFNVTGSIVQEFVVFRDNELLSSFWSFCEGQLG